MLKTERFKKNPKRVVILGTSGIIASNLIREIKKTNIKVLAIGRKEIDLKSKDAYRSLSNRINKSDTIVFISAEAPVKNLMMLSNNLKICSNVFKALEKKKIRQLIYVSSDAVYSDIKKKINEKSEILPTSLHGFMHMTREKILKSKFEKILCILRPTLIYGKGDTHNGYGPNRFINLANKNKNIKLFGRGEELRDHIYIEDIVKIIIECIIKKATGVLNLASGKVYSFDYLAKAIIRLSKSKSKVLKTKRVGKMPHNGYRPFNIKSLKENFPRVKIGSLKKNLEEYILYN
tara:strand:+ start:443 stop:1315 length:873 start_codon:yes stop_codon:yes gene_type:complete